ncbi:MAG: hypothetical protein Q8M94_09305 [Ignavibacteria bacterium]|nr:hypothetical protein [Ignavibacteria bacterium]
MKKTFILLLSFLIVLGCSEDNTNEPTQNDPTGSEIKEREAYTLMESEMVKAINGNFTTASDYDQLKIQEVNALFRSAIDLDPTNTKAQFGAAITEILVAYWDSTVNNVIKEFEGSSFNKPISGFIKNALIPTKPSQMVVPIQNSAQEIAMLYKTALKDPPLISRVQAVLRDKLLPRIEFAIARLEVCEGNAAFRYKISGKMQGDPNLDTVSIYRTEVFLTNAIMHGLKFMINAVLIYKFDLPDYSQASLVQALQQNSTSFFYMNTDGRSMANNAKLEFQSVLNKFKAGIADLENISGHKNDAIIKLGNNGIKQADLDSVKNYLDDAINSFNNDVSVELKDADSDGNDYTVNVNLANFFNNLPDNPKSAFLPQYQVVASGQDDIQFRFTANTYSEFSFPDPTLGGLLPGMTNEVLKRILYIDEEYGFRLYANINNINNTWNWGYINPVKIKIQTNTNSYEKYSDNWGQCKFIIKDATLTPVNITHYFVDLGSGYIQFYPLGTSPIQIVAKQSDWVSYYIFTQPVLNNPVKLTNPTRINLTWSVNGASSGNSYFVIQRKKAGESDFSNITLPENYYNFYNYTFDDQNFTVGSFTQYRIMCSYGSYYYGNYLISPQNIYSNVVSITP